MNSAEKTRLGIFVVISIAAIVGIFVILAGIELMEETEQYETHFEETVSGLEIGAQVKYNGVRVGQVSDIRINPEKIVQVKVLLELRGGTPVKRDTRAVLKSMGITGLKFIELTGGTDASEPLPEGGAIASDSSFVGTMEGKAEDIAVKVELAVSRINELLTKENVDRFGRTLKKVEGTFAKTDALLGENDDDINMIVDDIACITGTLDEGVASAGRSADVIEDILVDAKPKVSRILDHVDTTTLTIQRTAKKIAAVDGVLANLESTLAEVNDEIHAVDVAGLAGGMKRAVNEADATLRAVRRIIEASRENIYRSSESLETTMRNLKDFSDEIRDQPSLLLSSEPPANRPPPERERGESR